MEPYMYDEFSKREEDDWWFVGRRKIISNFLEKYLGNKRNLTILDIGCGAGGIINLLSHYGTATGVDKNEQIARFNRKNGRKVICGDLVKLDFPDSSFDLVSLLEVLEHVEDDIRGLKEVYRVLKPGGTFFISVPVFPLLWSSHDNASHHKRRYLKGELLGKLSKSGFRILNVTYFDSFLFPIIVSYRFWTNLVGKDKYKSNFIDLPSTINSFLKLIFSSESFFLKRFNFPLGVSLLVIARKKEKKRRS